MLYALSMLRITRKMITTGFDLNQITMELAGLENAGTYIT